MVSLSPWCGSIVFRVLLRVPIVDVAGIGIFFAFPNHAVSWATLGMHVFGRSIGAEPALGSVVVFAFPDWGISAELRGTLLLAQKGGPPPLLSGRVTPLPGPAWCTWSCF